MEQKITLAEMRAGGARGLIVFCADYRCGHHIKIPPETVAQWPDDLRLSDLEPKFTCQKCGRRGADVRPDFDRPRMGTG